MEPLPNDEEDGLISGAISGVDVADRHFADYALDHWKEIQRLGLEPHVAELEALGLAVIPPDKVAAPSGFAERLRDAILRVHEQRFGESLDFENLDDPRFAGGEQGFGRQLFYILLEDDVFQEAVMNPAGLAMATYLLGDHCILNNCVVGLKGPGSGDLGTHCDNAMIPGPFSPYAHVCNVTWALTPYEPGSGQLTYVPGSHRLSRWPTAAEARAGLVPVAAEAGSIIFWHGNTWHGAIGRTQPGLRVNLIVSMMRSYLWPQEAYKENVTPEILANNPPRFAKLVSQHVRHGWNNEQGPVYESGYTAGMEHPFD